AGAAPNSYYYLRVLALNGSGVASSTAMAAAPGLTYAQDPAATAAPYVLNVTSATVFWSGQSNPAPTQYRVQRSLIGDNFSLDSYQDDSSWQSDRSSWTFYSPALVAGGTYYFRVKAKDQLNRETGWVALASTQTMVYAPGLSAQEVFTTSVTMRWNNSNPAGVQFQAEFSGVSDFSVLLASSNWTYDIVSWDFPGLTPNTHYYGRVRARNSSGVETSNTNVLSAFTLAAQPGLNLSDYALGGTDILINWGKSGNPQPDTLYQAVRASTADFSAGTATSAWISANNYNFSGLAPGATYYFRVKARNGDLVETPWTALPSSVTLPAPTPPTGLVLSYADGASTDRLQLDWTDNATTEIGYYIYESTDGVSNFDTNFDNRPPNSVSYLRTTLTPATRYYYKVSAYNANGGSFSNIVSSYTRAALPIAADFSAVQTNSLRANWGANGNPSAASYVCELSTRADFTPLTASSQTYNNFADFSGLAANVVYYAQVKAVNGGGVATAYVSLTSTRTLPLAMSFAVVDQAPTGILQGDSKAYARLNVSPSGTGASWTALTVKRDGTGLDADVTKLSLRRDGNLDGVYQAGNDPEVAWAAFASSQAALSFDETLNAAATYFLVMQAADNFISWPGNSIGLTVVSTASITSSNSQLTQSPAPFTSALSTITKLADVLNVSGQDKAPMPNVSRGVANIVFMKLSVAAARDRAFVRQVAVDKLGTLADNMVAGVKLYADTNGNGVLNTGDALITSGNDLFAGGSAALSLVNPSTRAAANETWFLTLDLDAAAPLGATVGVRIANAAAVGLMAGTPDSAALNAT
ncbi:MAG: hypothetical protein A2V88_13175, partial [Elusimicrobia bacterium RBG_16_66_12]